MAFFFSDNDNKATRKKVAFFDGYDFPIIFLCLFPIKLQKFLIVQFIILKIMLSYCQGRYIERKEIYNYYL